MHSISCDSCLLKEYLIKSSRCRTTWCPTNGTGGSLPRSSRIPTFHTSAPASPSPLAAITGKGPPVKMVRHPCLGLLAEAGHLEEPQIPQAHYLWLWLELTDVDVEECWVPLKGSHLCPGSCVCCPCMCGVWAVRFSGLIEISPQKSSAVSKALSNKEGNQPSQKPQMGTYVL